MERKKDHLVEYKTQIIFEMEKQPLRCRRKEIITPQAVNDAGDRIKKRTERIAAMLEALADIGFAFFSKENTIIAVSENIEAQSAKKYLLERGFQDGEFQVRLDYTRAWGML